MMQILFLPVNIFPDILPVAMMSKTTTTTQVKAPINLNLKKNPFQRCERKGG